MENKMAEVAKLLGLELNEEFGLKNSNFRYKLTRYGLRKRYLTVEEWGNSCMLDDLLLGRVEIVKKAKSILDEAEKRYLSNIIKPFRDRIVWIRKCEYDRGDFFYGEYIVIGLKFFDSETDQETDQEQAALPSFEKGTMYKGMQVGKDYTLEELCL